MVMFLIIENISKVKIHFFFYVMMFVSLFTGNIIDYLIFTSIIVVHEMGHILGGLFFSWKIEKIIVLPFGGLTIFNNLINTSLFQQFVVTFLGPLFQVLFFLIIRNFFCLSDSVIYYNFVLLFFNLLPIYPLDGSKFLYVLLCFLFPFKYSHLILLFISFLFIFIVFIFVGKFDFLVFLIMFFLIFKCVCEFRNHSVIFNKFLFERYCYDFNFKHLKVVRSINGMYLWCRHLIYTDKKYVTESNYIRKMFDNNSDL